MDSHTSGASADDVVDDIFGESTSERPGWFDAGLFASGTALLLWALLAGASGLALVGGIAAMVLGSALPLRSLSRVFRQRRVGWVKGRTLGKGYAFDVSTPAAAELATAYGALLDAAAQPGVLLHDDAVSAAHLAMIEAASLLQGAAPVAPLEVQYVQKRSEAMRALTGQLVRQHERWLASRSSEAAQEEEGRKSWATALTQAHNELEADDRLDSLDSLGALTKQFEQDGAHE